MGKKYISSFFLLVFGLLCNVQCFAQVVANDDTFSNLNGITGSGNYYQTNGGYRVITNDLLNGNSISTSQVVLTQISTTHPSVTLVTNFGGYINVGPGTPEGTYYVEYQICSAANPNLCDMGLITVNVCALPAPIILSGCNTPLGTVELGGLPSTGIWTLLRKSSSQSGYSVVTSGSGSSYTDSGLASQSCYYYKVQYNGCSSADATFCTSSLDGIEGVTSATYVDENNDGVVNLGDIVEYNLTITNTLDCILETVNYYIEGAPNTSGSIFNLAAGTSQTVTINYMITQEDINSGYVFEWIALVGLSNGYTSYTKVFAPESVEFDVYDGILLIPFLDVNSNGIRDSNEEEPFNSGFFQYQVNNIGYPNFIYLSSGSVYIYVTNPSNVYNISYSLGSNDCQYSLTTTSYNNITVPNGSGFSTYFFPITLTSASCTDLSVCLNPIESPRPGFTYKTRIYYQNTGNQTVSSSTIAFEKDDLLTITNVSVSGAVMTATGFTYALSNLEPNESGTIDVTLQVPTIPEIALGDTLTNSASVTMSVEDTVQDNNSSILTQTVVGSYDPNDKLEIHGGKILHSTFTENDYLTYTIRFENTGTANATTIQIEDELDQKLDESSLRMVYASHNYILERVTNNLLWTLNEVNLPPSSETVSGSGYIVFQIKPKPDYAVGDIISNAATIYFDFNPPIVTEPVTTEFVSILGTDNLAFDSLDYYPNPVKNLLTISSIFSIDTVTITSVLGQVILNQEIGKLNTTLDLSGLTTGIYFVNVKSSGQDKTIKILKD